MKFKVEYSKRALKDLQKLDHYTRHLIYSWIGKNLMDCTNPRIHGKPLSANYKGLWRYRIGSYRLICKIEDEQMIILAISVGHRRDIYR